MKNEKWFELGIPQVERKLKTNAASGLSRKAARSRIDREAGSVFLLPRRSRLLIVRELFLDVSLLILLLTALVSLCFDDGRASAAVVTVLLVCELAVLGYRHGRARRHAEAALLAFAPTVRVVRGGKLFCVDFQSVAVGDVILVEAGDVLPCDARIVNSDSLRVRMRLDRDRECVLDKQADGFVDPKERRASQMVNMLHAGSVVEQGSARAIVTAVGRYTYLGAMTGGIEIPINERQPRLLSQIGKQSARLNLWMLLAILPLTVISLLLSRLLGGSAYLSVTFFAAIALCATTLSPTQVLWMRLFYTRRVRTLLQGESPMQVASVEALERLGELDCLFVTDGCAMTDGILHFQTAITAEGEVRDRPRQDETARTLCEMASLYHTAATGTVTTGVSGVGEYLCGLRELERRCGVDPEAMRLRYAVSSYLPASLNDACEYVRFRDRGVERMLAVSCSPRMLFACDSVLWGGVRREMTDELRERLMRTWRSYSKRPMIFMQVDPRLSGSPCLIGMVVLREGVDPKLSEHIAAIERTGCRVICFVPNDPNLPSLPDALTARGVVSKNELIAAGLPLTHQFGRFRVYSDFSREDILTLLKYARAKGKRVAVLGFGTDAALLAESADSLVSCTALHSLGLDRVEDELGSLEIAGRSDSVSCSQEQKMNAEYLIERPHRERGGLDALAEAIGGARRTASSVAAFWRYLVFAGLIRLLVVVIPLLLGRTVLDARHVIYFATVCDGFAMAAFLLGDYRFGGVSRRESTAPHEILLSDRPRLISSIAAAAACLILPQVLGLTGLTERYIYTTEFTLLAMMILQPVLLWTALGEREDRERPILFSPWVWGSVAVSALLILLCMLWRGAGDALGWERNPWQYSLLALAPALIYAGLYRILRRFGKKEKK